MDLMLLDLNSIDSGFGGRCHGTSNEAAKSHPGTCLLYVLDHIATPFPVSQTCCDDGYIENNASTSYRIFHVRASIILRHHSCCESMIRNESLLSGQMRFRFSQPAYFS
jgi:hypothetical protein